jgi:hypothetical protein
MNEEFNYDAIPKATNHAGFNVEIFQPKNGWICLEKKSHPSHALAEVRMKTIYKHLPKIGELRVYEALSPAQKKTNTNFIVGA